MYYSTCTTLKYHTLIIVLYSSIAWPMLHGKVLVTSPYLLSISPPILMRVGLDSNKEVHRLVNYKFQPKTRLFEATVGMTYKMKRTFKRKKTLQVGGLRGQVSCSRV